MTLLIEWLIEGTALALVATLVAALIPARYAAQRHAFWWLTLVWLVALPALSIVTPTIGTAASGSAGSEPGAVVVPQFPLWLVASVALAWVVTTAVSLGRLTVGVFAVRRLAREARPLPPDVSAALQHAAREGVSWRPARIVVSSAIDGACAAGLWRPCVVLSTSLVNRLEPDALEAVVLHEQAHIGRFDDWSRLVQRILLAVMGLHPAMWWISRQIDVECEAACDRSVVERTASPARYAEALARVGDITRGLSRRPPLSAPGALISRAGLHARVVRLLSSTRVSRRLANSASALAAAAVTLAATLAAATPPLVVTASVEASLAHLASEPLATLSGGTLVFAPVSMVLPAPRSSSQPGQASHPPERPQRRLAFEVLTSEEVAIQPANTQAIVQDRRSPLEEETGADHDSPLSSVPFPLISSSGPEPRGSAERQTADSWNAVGSVASRAGVAAGDRVARAGSSVGRAFKKGGLAFAGTFDRY